MAEDKIIVDDINREFYDFRYEESEKDNKTWREMYRSRDEIILEKERSMLTPVIQKKHRFWKG